MRPLSFLSAIIATTLLLSSPFFVLATPEDDNAQEGEKASSFAPEPPRPEHNPQDTKYFHEPGGSDVLGHYDIRYFKGEPVFHEEKTDTLQHLIRSYLNIFREQNIETWIAHGTLLGWWWNGKTMPWDWDLDTQVSSSTLSWLAENMNMTTHNYTSLADDGTQITREYLLDVNPNYLERVRGDGMNVIDARWIDVRNGLFIDITGLSEVNPSTQPGVWSCKNYHRYRTRDIYPLRKSEFEGVMALVPYSFDKVLTDEYGQRALTKTLHEGHRWNPEQKEWVPLPQVSLSESDFMDHDHPHMPDSIQTRSRPKSGLRNLRNLRRAL